MTNEPAESAADIALTAPAEARKVFLGLGGVAFVAMLLCLLAYRVFGAQITAGLDEACAEAWYDAGQKFAEEGNLPMAVEKYRKAMNGHFGSESQRLECGLAIGDLLFHLKRYGEAVDAYKALPETAFTHSGAYTGYVTALWRMGRLDEAARLGAVWLAMADGEKKGDQQLWARENLMRVAQAQGDQAGALAYGQALLELDPEHSARLIVARLLRDEGKLEEARAQAKILANNTRNPSLQRAGRELLDQMDAPAALPGTP